MLLALSTSRVRAALIAALFGDDPRPRHLTQLATELGVAHRSIQRELERLVAAGFVIRSGELTDDWDDDWDPFTKFDPSGRPLRSE